jgi:uncharacterized protein involved in response to NO
MSTLTVLAEGVLRPLFLPAPVFGIIALVIFAVMGFMVFSYRDVANRHAHKNDTSGSGHH